MYYNLSIWGIIIFTFDASILLEKSRSIITFAPAFGHDLIADLLSLVPVVMPIENQLSHQ